MIQIFLKPKKHLTKANCPNYLQGGMKAVMWTDTVQVIIMFISMAVVGFLIHLLK
jgi:hypothetical protein